MNWTRPNYEKAKSLVSCKNHVVKARKRVNRGGAVTWIEQCRVCGEKFNFLKARDILEEEKALADDYDEALNSEFHMKLQDEIRRLDLADKEAQDAARNSEWWTWYNAYLRSPEWQKIRAKVLKRANGVCEGCGESGAVQVHHKTYDRVGHEMLFDLVAVCEACHQLIHQKAGAA